MNCIISEHPPGKLHVDPLIAVPFTCLCGRFMEKRMKHNIFRLSFDHPLSIYYSVSTDAVYINKLVY